MKNNETPMESLFGQLETYGNTKIELIKLQSIALSADYLSTVACSFVIAIAVSLFVFVINIGVALWLGALLGNSYLGFFIVAGFYAILALVLYIFRHRLIKYPLNDAFIMLMRKKR